MKTIVLVGALAASLLFGGPGSSAPAQTAVVSGCAQMFSVKDYRQYASSTYKRKSVSTQAQLHLARVERCQHTPWAKRTVARFHHRYKRERTTRREIAAFTPYSCSFGHSAIPCYIVICESGGDWTAANPSGAVGRYEFLGKNIVWPVRTEADKAAHDRLASRLWAGGSGASNWSQCL